jgi:hypothetical protein
VQFNRWLVQRYQANWPGRKIKLVADNTVTEKAG